MCATFCALTSFRHVKRPSQARTVPRAASQANEAKSDEYSKAMQEKMGKNLVYIHEDGMNYNLIKEDIIVGSCLQTPDDVDTLKEAGVSVVICLQQDTDMAYFDLDIEPVQDRAGEVDLRHVRLRINDMDPLNLRLRLPDVIAQMHKEVTAAGPGKIYVHCTAGMGRAPAVALAYMWWVHGLPLDPTFDELRSKRWCSPAISAIRQAAADMLYGGTRQRVLIRKKGTSNSSEVFIAGLDVGWGGRLPLEKEFGDTWSVQRELLPGKYPYKFIMDGVWSFDMDKQTICDGENINNVVEVLPQDAGQEAMAARRRLLSPGGELTDDEVKIIREKLDLH
eukprot:jgi/Ulvmu1/8168/UM040_0065.1